jgi:hypothetical protein
MKIMCLRVATVLFISLAPPAVFSSEDDCFERGKHIGEVEQLPRGYRSKIYGTVESLPDKRLSGVWVVNGRQVIVTEGTFIEEKHGAVNPGAFVEIKAIQSGYSLIATNVEVKRAKASDSPATTENTISGTIENLPKGLWGTWVVSGKEVLVLKETVIKGKNVKPDMGVPVLIQGTVSGETFIVSRIEIKQTP